MTTATRPVMTRDELAKYEVKQWGRNYAESDDGYSDMEAEEKRGWYALSGWGRDGWDLGNWPYVVIYGRTAGDTGSLFVVGRRFELLQICEGDRTAWAFETREDRQAAIDYLFLWYSADESWSPVTWKTREKLDAGELEVDEKFRGPYRG